MLKELDLRTRSEPKLIEWPCTWLRPQLGLNHVPGLTQARQDPNHGQEACPSDIQREHARVLGQELGTRN